MRTARSSKNIHESNSGRGEPMAVKDLSAKSSTTLIDTLAWKPSTAPKQISRSAVRPRPTQERRAYTRAKLSLPLRVKRIAGQREHASQSLRTMDISSSGVLFLYPEYIEPGTPVEIEVSLVDRPLGQGSVRMMTEAHIVRAERTMRPGWHALAVSFDEITFKKDDPLPSRFEKTQ
jgi:hypothetical protein